MYWSNNIFAPSLQCILVSAIIHSPMILAEPRDSVLNGPPRIVSAPLFRATPELLKQGLWGSCSVEAWIDSVGSVDSCTVVPSKKRAFDSLVKSNVIGARFTPAIETGRAVSSQVRFEISAPYDSLIAQCLRLPANFTGKVIDTARRMPLPKTNVLISYTDTTEDSSVAIGFSHYLSLIGNQAGQKYNGAVLNTITDSLGRFTFRLLPRGHITVSVQAQGYEIGKFRGFITGDGPQQSRYFLRASEVHFHDNSNEITVYGRQTFAEEKIVIAEEEKRTGFSPLLSNVVQTKAEIRRVPEGPSMMLVRSGCPYDNVYVIAGVPMLAPFHFGGYPYTDIDGLMISALSKVNVTINDIAAKRIDASGCIVEIDPGKIKYDQDSIGRGFFLKGDVCYVGMDFLGAYSSKKKKEDFVQIGYSVSDNYMLKFNKFFYRSVSQGNQGIGIPVSYGNATLSGSKSVGPLRSTVFGWLAWDSYYQLKATDKTTQHIRDSLCYFDLADKTLFPWGMGSIKFTTDSSNRALTIGGAHQFFGTGKQFITTINSTRSILNNGEVIADLDTIIAAPFVAKLTARFSHDEWNGFFSQQKNDSINTPFRVHGTETGMHLNTSIVKQTGRITTELDMLASVIKYANSVQSIGDAGASILYNGNDYHAGLHFGRATSRPDIRGLPDSLFRMHLNRTYIASLPLFFRFGIVTKFGIEPYVRYCTNAPQLDPIKQIWDPNKSTPVWASGVDFDCRIVPTSWTELSTALNFADARRQSATGDSLAYEWSLPWTIRTGLHLHSKNDRFHLYVDYIRSKGLPYFDIKDQSYETLPLYRSLDFNFQIRNIMPPQRYINKLDGYVTLKNAQDLLTIANVRDFYWDNNGNRQPIFLGYGRMDIGVRFGIRL